MLYILLKPLIIHSTVFSVEELDIDNYPLETNVDDNDDDLRPTAAKTIHRSLGDTEQKIVVNFNTRRAIPHIHYVGLSRVTTIEGLYITDLCEEKNSC